MSPEVEAPTIQASRAPDETSIQTPGNAARSSSTCSPRMPRRWVALQKLAQPAGASAYEPPTNGLQRFREEEAGLVDRSSPSEILPHRSPAAVQVQVIAQRSRWTYRQISQQCAVVPAPSPAGSSAGWPQSTWRPSDPQPPSCVIRHPGPGDMLHLIIKKLGRFRRPGPSGHRRIARKPRPAPVENLSMSPSTTTQESPLPTFSLTERQKCLPGAARLPALPLVRHLLPASPDR